LQTIVRFFDVGEEPQLRVKQPTKVQPQTAARPRRVATAGRAAPQSNRDEWSDF
jgi:hypothetical protein